MRKIVFLGVVAMLAMTVSGQVAKFPPKVIAVHIGDKNPTWDESRFPDIEFYYLPNLKLVEGEKTKKKSTGMKAFQAAMNAGSVGYEEFKFELEGTPQEVIDLKLGPNKALVFDKNGTFAASQNIDNDTHLDRLPFHTGVGDAKEYANMGDLMRDFCKKGKTVKEGKKMKATGKKDKATKERAYRLADYRTFHLPDFEVTSSKGDNVTLSQLTKGNPATMVVFFYTNPDFDYSKGTESGAEKSAIHCRCVANHGRGEVFTIIG